jgi:hypothetical protein
MNAYLCRDTARNLFWAESQALDEGRDFFCIRTRESVLAQWLAFNA